MMIVRTHFPFSTAVDSPTSPCVIDLLSSYTQIGGGGGLTRKGDVCIDGLEGRPGPGLIGTPSR